MTLTKELHKTKTLKIPKLLVLVEKVILQQLMSKLKIISEGGCPGYKLRVGAVVSSSLSCTVIITIVIILSIIIFKFKKWKKNKKERVWAMNDIRGVVPLKVIRTSLSIGKGGEVNDGPTF